MTDHLSVEQQDHDAAEPKSVSNHKGNVARGVVSVIRSSFCSKIPLGSSCPRRSIQRTCCQTESSRGMTAFALGAASAAGPDFSLALAIRTNREARFHRVIISRHNNVLHRNRRRQGRHRSDHLRRRRLCLGFSGFDNERATAV